MRQTILAKRYAKALFAVGREEGKSEAFRETLNVLGDFLETYPEAMDALTNPLYPMELREKVIAHLISELQADQLAGNFLSCASSRLRFGVIITYAGIYAYLHVLLLQTIRNLSRFQIRRYGEIQLKIYHVSRKNNII